MVTYKETKTEYLKEFVDPKKQILGLQGRLFVTCDVSVVRGGSRSKGKTREQKRVVGVSSGNMDYFDKHFYSAIQNALSIAEGQKHEDKGLTYDFYSASKVYKAFLIRVVDYEIRYFNAKLKIKRVNKRGRYYNRVFDEDGERIAEYRAKYVRPATLNKRAEELGFKENKKKNAAKK